MSGTFQTPQFPHDYTDNLNCQKRIQAIEGSQIHVAVEHLDIEFNKLCVYDRLNITVRTIEYINVTVSIAKIVITI